MQLKSRLFERSPEERKQILNTIRQVLETRPEVVFAYVHGSILEDLPIHDVDVAVFVASDAGDDGAMALELAAELEKAIPPALRLPVDVRLLNEAPTGFCFHAFRGKLLFSRDEELRGTMVERTIIIYLDRKPILDRALKEAMTA